MMMNTDSPPLPPNSDFTLSVSYGEPALKMCRPRNPAPPWLEPDTHWPGTRPLPVMRSPPGPRPVKTF